ncbi:MAG: 3-deoxy-manno-octulosonate cytidylyltransferase [Nitrospirota bacterium]|nr:3-deoxy-manno-octulosonate cytidylyltransferase [Nitrospirota bacterium]
MKDKKPSIIAVIPARFGSTRFPGKSLASIQGRPMIQWVYERTKRSALLDRVIVATDDVRIRDAVMMFGGEAMMTSVDHATGTDRIAEVAGILDCDIVVNVQGDEPLIRHEMIDEAVRPLADDPLIPMGTIATLITDQKETTDPNVVKVVMDKKGFALYFSRAPIPWDRDGIGISGQLASPVERYKHIGLYVYRREFLLSYAKMPSTPLEESEKLEQLRALEQGYRIRVVVTKHQSFGVDIPDDLSKILKCLEEGRG